MQGVGKTIWSDWAFILTALSKAVTLDMPKLRATDGLDGLLRLVEPLICYTLAAAALRAGDRHKTGLSLALKNYWGWYSQGQKLPIFGRLHRLNSDGWLVHIHTVRVIFRCVTNQQWILGLHHMTWTRFFLLEKKASGSLHLLDGEFLMGDPFVCSRVRGFGFKLITID